MIVECVCGFQTGEWSEADIRSMLEIGPIGTVAQNGLFIHDGSRGSGESMITKTILKSASKETTVEVGLFFVCIYTVSPLTN